MIDSGVELQEAWNVLRQEGLQSSNYLGRELEGPLHVEVEGAGECCKDGSTRKKITTWLEDMRLAVLVKSLESFPDQTARPVWVHPQLNKLSQGWILSLPGHKGFTQEEFTETVARLLCLPSPCCQDKVGTALGQYGL